MRPLASLSVAFVSSAFIWNLFAVDDATIVGVNSNATPATPQAEFTLPGLSNPIDFCAAAVKAMKEKLPAGKSLQAARAQKISREIDRFVGAMAKRLESDGSVSSIRRGRISDSAWDGLRLTYDALGNNQIDFRPALVAGFKAHLDGLSAEERAKAEGAIQAMSPQQAQALFLTAAGIEKAMKKEIDRAQEAEATRQAQRIENEKRYHAVVRDMNEMLFKRWKKGKFSPEVNAAIEKLRGELKTNPKPVSISDQLVLGQMIQDDLLYYHWGLDAPSTLSAAQEAMTLFLTRDEPIRLNQEGRISDITPLERAFNERVIKKASDVDFMEMNALWVESSEAERANLGLLKSALSQSAMSVPLALVPSKSGGTILVQRFEIAEALLAYYEAASRYSHGKAEAIDSLSRWLIQGEEDEITSDQFKRLKSVIEQTLPVAKKIFNQRARGRFYRLSFKSLGALLLLTSGASALSEGLNYAGVEQAPSWATQRRFVEEKLAVASQWSLELWQDAKGEADKIYEAVKQGFSDIEKNPPQMP